MNNDDVVSTLEELIEITKDGINGFNSCAEKTESVQLKSVFNRAAARCEQGLIELNQALVSYGGNPEDTDGSLIANLHRGWLDLKTALSSNDDKAILEECERGEDVALESYRKALENDLPADVKALVAHQAAGVQSNHDQIKLLRDQIS